MTGPCFIPWIPRAVSQEAIDVFFLKFQRDNQKNALALAPAKGKTGKKAVFSTTLWR